MRKGMFWIRRYIECKRNLADDDSRLADQGLLRPGQSLAGAHAARVLANAAGKTSWKRNATPPGPAVAELFAGSSQFSALRQRATSPPRLYALALRAGFP